MKLSIVIPTLNEAAYCTPFFDQLIRLAKAHEIIVVDGGSLDETVSLARERGFLVIQTKAGRAVQLSKGALEAKGDFLLFLHADLRVDETFTSEIERAIEEKVELAAFKIRFDKTDWFLSANAFFSRFTHPNFHFGDQGLWISRELYQKCGGYDESAMILEDQDIYRRACKFRKAVKFNSTLAVSARKYRKYGVFRLQFFYYRLWMMSKLGYSNALLAERYKDFLNPKKPGDT